MSGPATRVVLRPVATPLPLGFLALALATVVFSAVQLGWVPPDQGRIAGLTALAATVPLQLTAAVVGFLARDPVAATGMGVLTGTWATVARHGAGRAAVRGKGPLAADDLSAEAGVRPQL
jgi:hypothetical protein